MTPQGPAPLGALPQGLTPHGPGDLGFGELFGRESELLRLRAWLARPARVRLLTLTGPAGVGKSHLAHAAVTPGREDGTGGARGPLGAGCPAPPPRLPVPPPSLPDPPLPPPPPSVWVDLADAPDAAAFWARLGVRDAREAAARIAGADLLLVLDNGDRLVADIALDVAALLRSCPGLRTLLTSRVPLDIRAERLFPVGPLPTGAGSPAEALFAERVRPYHRPGVDSGPGRLAVGEICRLLDGLPLAVEMAAEAVGTEGPRALLERLERGDCDPGRHRARDTPERHRSVAAALTWPAGTPGEGDPALLRALSVFDTYIDPAAVRRVTGLDHSAAVAGIDALLHKSLLLSTPGQDGEPELRLTYMARAYHRARLAADPGELRRVLDGHAAHWVAYAEATAQALRAGRHLDQVLHAVAGRLPDVLKAARHLTSTGDHLAALRLLTALEVPLLRHRLAPEAADAVEAAADAWTAAGRPATRAAGGEVVAGALVAVGRWAVDRGEYARAARVLERADSAAAELPVARARVAAATGELLRRMGESTSAADVLEPAVRRLDAHGDRRTAALARRGQALLRAAHADPDAERPLLRALEDVPDDAALRASLLTALARVRRTLGRDREAHETAREAARLLMGTGDPAQVAEALETVAVTSGGACGDGEQRRHAVARVLAHAEAVRRRYGVVPDGDDAAGELARSLVGSPGARPLRELRRDAERVSLHDALVAALFAPAPAPEPARAARRGTAPHGLTPRQHQIALLVAEGLTNRQIARRLGISEWTVTNHLRVVMQKLGCASRVHVVRAVQGGTP
ncbi:LuxR C-terminal-related transcriptional regulator [Streptomyces sp. NPDC021100]|uniref:LuxR C-terminal-related transcriptional regulator n=1 Tax=Streptomyces sp. NPDC021100 TaxID=3365114 RepID=UPI0037A3F3EA